MSPSAASPRDARIAKLLDSIGAATGHRALLWRGPGSAGSDIDIAVLSADEGRLRSALREEGLVATPADEGRTVWRELRADGAIEIDAWPEGSWPARYPPLVNIAARASEGRPLAVASPGDRLVVYAVDAVSGRPLAKLARRAAAALAEPGAQQSLEQVSQAEHAAALARLSTRLGGLAERAPRGRFSYPRALAAACRSPMARSALAKRAVESVLRLATRKRDRAGLLIALSGMDGSGKSTAAERVRDQLADLGRPAQVGWARLGNEGEVLDRVARPVKRILGARATVADPVAAGGPALEAEADRPRRRGPVAWLWTLFVAGVNVRGYRRAARPARSGTAVVCDRWLTDSLVDLELRYGRHRAARRLLSLGVPRPDLAVLLEIDARTSRARKPGDQADRVLVRMERLYRDAAAREKLVVLDARRSREEVGAALARLVADCATDAS